MLPEQYKVMKNVKRLWGELAPKVSHEYFEDEIIDYIHNTNKIEGSTLTKADTEIALKGGTVVGKEDWVQAARNIHDAHKFITGADISELSNDFIKSVHYEVTKLIIPNAGEFKTQPVYAAGRYETTPSHLVSSELESIKVTPNMLIVNPLKAAVDYHIGFEYIHPFTDGNGRTGRVLFNWMMIGAGFPLMNFSYKTAGDYHRGFRAYQMTQRIPDWHYWYYVGSYARLIMKLLGDVEGLDRIEARELVYGDNDEW